MWKCFGMHDKVVRRSELLLWSVTGAFIAVLLLGPPPPTFPYRALTGSPTSAGRPPRHYYNITVQPNNPTIVWWTIGANFYSLSQTIKCSKNSMCNVFSYEDRFLASDYDAYLFRSFEIDNIPLPRRAKDIIWGLYYYETPRVAPLLMHDKALRLFNFSATYSRYSDVPFPLLYLRSLANLISKQYFITTHFKNIMLTIIAPVIYLQSNCDSTTERDRYVKKLMEYIQIDSYGGCLNNKPLPETIGNKLDYHTFQFYGEFTVSLIAQYKFIISIENAVCEDYMSEKLWRPLELGVVPIYLGSPSVRDWLPNPRSAILLEDFPTPRLLASHLKALLLDDNLYEQYLEHKIEGKITNERLKREFTSGHYQTDQYRVFECFVCDKLHRLRDSCEVNMVNRDHLNCPRPVSAWDLLEDPGSTHSLLWDHAGYDADVLYDEIMEEEKEGNEGKHTFLKSVMKH